MQLFIKFFLLGGFMATKQRLLNPDEARIGVLFLDTLAFLHVNEEHPKAGAIGEDFQINKQVVAQMSPFHCHRYGDLPNDAKSFVSRCAGIMGACKRRKERITMRKIVIEQFRLVQHQSDVLYAEVMGMLSQAAMEAAWRNGQAERLAEWYEDAARRPFHSYHPEEIPHEFLHTNPTAFRPL